MLWQCLLMPCRLMTRSCRRFARDEPSRDGFRVPSANPTCAARVRIFTPKQEMSSAGYPTIGTSFVLLDQNLGRRDCESFFPSKKSVHAEAHDLLQLTFAPQAELWCVNWRWRRSDRSGLTLDQADKANFVMKSI